MARTSSVMIPLGTKAPDFTLMDAVTHKKSSLIELKGSKATLVAFICNHCPFVKHVNPQLIKLANEYHERGVSVIAISSNDVIQYPEDGPIAMKENALHLGYPFPYLYDETQEVAKAFNAVCTPDFFVFDNNLFLAYRGQLDDSRPGNGIEVTGKDIRNFLDCLLLGVDLPSQQFPSIGCNIKWRE